VSSTPPVPPPAFLPPDPDRDPDRAVEATSAVPDGGEPEATEADIEAEVDVVSRINDPAHDDVFEHLRRKPDSDA